MKTLKLIALLVLTISTVSCGSDDDGAQTPAGPAANLEFIGARMVSETCTISGVNSYDVTIVAGSSDTEIIIQNFYDDNINVNATVNATDKSITIQSQPQSNYTVSGTGLLLANGEITLAFGITFGSMTNECQATLTK